MINKNDNANARTIEALHIDQTFVKNLMSNEVFLNELRKYIDLSGFGEFSITAKRTFKDSVFRMLYKDKKNLLPLYNALNGTNYTNIEDFTIVTLENAIYMSMKNDLAFVVDFQVYLYEHQSTYNPNMPLRDLIYIAIEYKKMADTDRLYSSHMFKIPTPHFVVFYNGEDERPAREELKLSDMFLKSTDSPNLELKVQVININHGKNKSLMEACDTLRDYSLFVNRVRSYRKRYNNLAEAVDKAVTDCISEGILAEFLKTNRAEVLQMCIFEYDEKAVMEVFKQDGYEDGLAAGRTEGHKAGLIEGRTEQLNILIHKKLEKGKSLEEIADDLEEDVSTIKKLIQKNNEKM